MCEREREREARREQEGRRRGRGCMDLTAYGTYRHPDCALLSSFLEVRTKEKKGESEERPGIGVS